MRDAAGDSSKRCQASGIAQGCPLSPYLFIIVQSVMFFDVDHAVKGMHPEVVEPDFLVCPDILYADDTMLASSSAEKLQTLLDAVIWEGKK